MNLTQRRTQSGFRSLISGFVAIFVVCICSVANASDPLTSWNDGPAKSAIVEFVQAVTNEKGKDYVEPAERIAVFDHDGTLWVEYPMYTQVLFAFERAKELAPQHPEWKTTQPFKAVLDNDLEALGAAGEKGLLELVMASHAGMSTDEFAAIATDWLYKARMSGCCCKVSRSIATNSANGT